MDKAEIGDDFVAGFPVKNGVDDLFCLSGKFLLASQQIDRDDKTDDKVPERLKHTDHAQGNRF